MTGRADRGVVTGRADPSGGQLDVALRHRFAGLTLDLAFSAPPGVTALFGRSGAGKTSVVNAVAGLLRPDAGRIVLGDRVLFDSADGIDLPVHRRRVGYVFQDARLFPHLSVTGNLDYGRRATGARPDKPGFDRVVDLLGIAPLLGRRPAALSGGERQRVAIGRALLARPEILLMDEPLAALDAPRKAEILPYLERLRDETALPILYVSHALSEVARIATTLVVIEAGQVVRAGDATALLSDPEAVPDLGVEEAGARLRGRVVAHHNDGLSEVACLGGRLFLPRVGAAEGEMVHVRVAASDVILSATRPEGLSALNVLPVTVSGLRRGAKAGVMVRLSAGEDALLSRISARAAEAMGLCEGMNLFAVIESVSVASRDVGAGGG